ncbi:MAG: glycerophosphodiester phosphodiesterase [Planctomycetes bacterium]|nr:glycerophosphodiester phosphodiesterase [Planctomycetota bacterium]
MTLFAPMYASFRIASGRLRPRHPRLEDSAGHLTIIAHRGASRLAPENTLAAVELAWRLGADAVEVDVHLARDGRIMVIHDETTDRTAGRHLEVATTGASQLRLLDVGRHKHPRFAGERIPYLEEVLQTVPPGRQLFVEIKCGPEILPALVQTLAGSGKRSQVVIIGFDLATVRAAKAVLPDVPAHWLCDKRVFASYDQSLVEQAKAGGVDGLDVHWTGLTRRFIQTVKAAGLRLYVWTVNDPAQALRLMAMGVDGITTNRPNLLRSRMEPPNACPDPWGR